MEHRGMHCLDIELTASHVQVLNGADAIAAFFGRLGYNTDTWTLQTLANLGMTADRIVRPIKKIELIANQEGLFQIYLFELASIMVAHTRTWARTFRNRAGNYLLVLRVTTNIWNDGRDFKEELIELLDASKFGRTEYTPYQVYMKVLFEYFKDDLEGEQPPPTRSAVELAEFQEDAVKKARKILSRYDGITIADSVGLGKTWIGKKLLEDFAYHLRQKALVACPASLRDTWERELGDAAISAAVLSQEELGRDEFDPTPCGDVDVVLIDESHNFRNRTAQRCANMEYLLGVDYDTLVGSGR
jgi:hypothetical protein